MPCLVQANRLSNINFNREKAIKCVALGSYYEAPNCRIAITYWKGTSMKIKAAIFIVLFCLSLAGCTNPIQSSKNSGSELVPTAPIESEWKTLHEPEKLIKLMDIDCDKIDSVSITKYQDNSKTWTVIKKDARSLTEICDLVSSLSIVQKETLSQENNTVYEITFYLPNENNAFMSFGPAFSGDIFRIGGSFIKDNNLSPYISIVQANDSITFNTIEKVLESLLADST